MQSTHIDNMPHPSNKIASMQSNRKFNLQADSI